MNDVASAVDRGSGVGADDQSAFVIDAIGNALDAALLVEQHPDGTTERVASLGVGGRERGVIAR